MDEIHDEARPGAVGPTADAAAPLPPAPTPASRALLRRLDDIEGVRREVLAEVEALPPRLRKAHPIPGKWSILEIIEHLVLAEEAFMRRFGAASGSRRATLLSRLKYAVVMFILRFDIPVRVPSRAMLPGGGADLEELRHRWDATQAGLREAVRGMDDERSRAPVAVHPVAGPMDAEQSLSMLDVHLRRHVRQIRSRMELLTADPEVPGARG